MDGAKRLVRCIVHDYRINWIYASTDGPATLPLAPDVWFGRLGDAEKVHIAANPDLQFRKALGYERSGAIGFTLSQDGQTLSVAHFIDATRYENNSTWPLRGDEVALVNIVTDEAARGRGHAATLICHATPVILATPFTRAIAFIWWNHRSSLRAFERAGWCRIGLSVEIIDRQGGGRHLHLPLPAFVARLKMPWKKK